MAAPAGAWKRPIPPEFRGSWADATDDHPPSDAPKSKAALRRERAARQKVLHSQNWTNKERDVFLAAQQRERDSGKQSKGVDAARRQRTLERWAKSEFHPLKPSQGVQYADILAIGAPTTPSAPTKCQPAKRKVKRDTKVVLVRDDRRRKPHKARVCKKLRRLTRLKKSVLADREAQFHGAPTSIHLAGVVAKLRDNYHALFDAHRTSDAEAVSVTEKRIARGVRQLGRARLAPSAVAAPTAQIASDPASTPTAEVVSSPAAVVADAPCVISGDENDGVTADVVAPLLRPLFPPLTRYVGLGAHPMAASLDKREGTHRLVRGFVTNVLSRDLDSATKGLLKRLEGLQHNARKREPLKYKKQQRFVLGLREVARGIEVGRIRLVAIAPDVEPAQDLDSRVEQIVAMCVERSIPHFFALSRSGFGHAVHKHDQRISVVGFYSVQGADEQGKELVRLARAAKEDAERILSEAPVS